MLPKIYPLRAPLICNTVGRLFGREGAVAGGKKFERKLFRRVKINKAYFVWNCVLNIFGHWWLRNQEKNV